jgi:hypothetical protein
MRRNFRSEEGSVRAHSCAPATRASRLANRASKARLNATAASALSITIGSLFWRLWLDAERFAATVRSNRPSISRLRASAFGAHGDRICFLESVFFAKPALWEEGLHLRWPATGPPPLRLAITAFLIPVSFRSPVSLAHQRAR